MNAANCLVWVKEFGGAAMDFRTNLNVAEWLADSALRAAETDDEKRLCELAKYAAQTQLSWQLQKKDVDVKAFASKNNSQYEK